MKNTVLSTLTIETPVLNSIVQAYIDGAYDYSIQVANAVKEPASMDLARLVALETCGLSVIAISAPINVYLEELQSWKATAKGRPGWAIDLQRDLFLLGYEDSSADPTITLTSSEIRGRQKEFETVNNSL